MQMYIHPLNEQHPGVYNICDDQLAQAIVNVQDALAIGSEQTKQLSASLSSDFHAIMKGEINADNQEGCLCQGKAVYNVETMFSRLLFVGHQQQHGCSRRLTVWVESGPSNPGRWLFKEGCQVCARQVYRCLRLDFTTSSACKYAGMCSDTCWGRHHPM